MRTPHARSTGAAQRRTQKLSPRASGCPFKLSFNGSSWLASMKSALCVTRNHEGPLRSFTVSQAVPDPLLALLLLRSRQAAPLEKLPLSSSGTFRVATTWRTRTRRRLPRSKVTSSAKARAGRFPTCWLRDSPATLWTSCTCMSACATCGCCGNAASVCQWRCEGQPTTLPTAAVVVQHMVSVAWHEPRVLWLRYEGLSEWAT